VVARADQAQERSAPALVQPLLDDQVQFLDYRVRLAVRGELSAAEVFIKPLLVPERLVIESLGVDHPVVPVAAREIEFQGETYQQWTAPRSGDLGWHQNSALVGAVGNTVINGHSSGYGETFQDLDSLENGDLIRIYAGEVVYTYAVANVILLKERWEPIEVRMENARWINRSRDERLTLISCWPANSNTHRVVVTALPVTFEQLPEARAELPGEHAQAPGSIWESTP
jgi:sortase A